ncbi:MAG TPA: hypothetical protein VHO70_17840 [Chitinispirillaceae bacterium]|nr:hypothetical protein [Chitinispirillaceae bacterium]
MTDKTDFENKLLETIKLSGYFKEQQTILDFENAGYFVNPNYIYEDKEEKQSREIDLLVTRHSPKNDFNSYFSLYVYGEVKSMNTPIIFFERTPKFRIPRDPSLPLFGTLRYFKTQTGSTPLWSLLNLDSIYHQSNIPHESSQFCLLERKNNDKNWEASHMNFFERTFLPFFQLIKSSIDDRVEQSYKYYDPVSFFNVSYYQPLVIISGPLYSYNINENKLKECDYIVYKRSQIINSINITLYFDIVSSSFLSSYITKYLNYTYDAILNKFTANANLINEMTKTHLQLFKQENEAKQSSHNSSTMPAAKPANIA